MTPRGRPGKPPGRLLRRHRGGSGRPRRARGPVQQQALVRVADRAGRRPDSRDPAPRLHADKLHQRVQRHRGRRGRPHPVQVSPPHRGPGHPGADPGHDHGVRHRPDRRPGRRARHRRRRPGGRPGGRDLSAAQPSQPARPAARPAKPEHLPTTAAHQASASTLAGSLVRYIVAGLGGLIVLLLVLLLVMRSRRERARAAATAAPGSARARPHGLHEHRRAEPEARARPGRRRARPGSPARRRAAPDRLTPDWPRAGRPRLAGPAGLSWFRPDRRPPAAGPPPGAGRAAAWARWRTPPARRSARS